MSRRRKDDTADLASVVIIAFCVAVLASLLLNGP